MTYYLMTDREGMVAYKPTISKAKARAEEIANDLNETVYICIDIGEWGYEEVAKVEPKEIK